MIGIIGGSGIYQLEGLADKHWEAIASPFGAPSDELLFGQLNGQQLVFLPRHGRGHILSPTDINYRANIDVLKRVGVTDIIFRQCSRFTERKPQTRHLRHRRSIHRPDDIP